MTETDKGVDPVPSLLGVAVMAVQLYAEMHPRPPHVNQQQASEMLGLSHVTVRKMIRAGTIKMNGAGQIPISEIDRVLRPVALNNGFDTGGH